jgi:FkbM family methyltransferase
MNLKNIKILIIFIYTIIISIRPIKKAIISLIFNRNTIVSFKSRYNKFDNIIINRYYLYILYLLLKVEGYNTRIIKLDYDKVILKYKNYIFFEVQTTLLFIDFFTEGLKLLNSDAISVIEVNDNNITITIKNLITLKAPLKFLILTISNMLSKKYYKTWYWDVDVKDKVVVDVGAYIGDSAVFFASRGARIVYAYEPSKELYEIAKENCSKYNNIILHNFGLSCSEKYAILIEQGGSKRVNDLAQNGEKVLLKSFNEELRKIIRKEGRIDVLKLDCEGCEWEFLNCLDEELIKHIQTIVVEIHGKDHNAFLKKLKKYGFKLKKLFGYKDIAMYTLQKIHQIW